MGASVVKCVYLSVLLCTELCIPALERNTLSSFSFINLDPFMPVATAKG